MSLTPSSPSQVFDKVTVLYEGRQIYFGPAKAGKKFFTDMGFVCPDRQTDPDFLTSLTSDLERTIAPGFENTAPRTPDEFVQRWKASDDYKRLRAEIAEYEQAHPVGGEHLQQFIASRKAQQGKGQRTSSPYTLTYGQQVKLCVWRGFRRLIANPEITITQLLGESYTTFRVPLIADSLFDRKLYHGAHYWFRLLQYELRHLQLFPTWCSAVLCHLDGRLRLGLGGE